MSLTLKQRDALRMAINSVKEIRARHDIGGEGNDHETYDISMSINTTELESILFEDQWSISYWLKRFCRKVAQT